MKSKYAFVVAANEKYLPPLNVLLNSLEKVGNKQDVHLISWALPAKYLAKLDQLGYRVIVHEVSGIPEMQALGEGEVLMRYRYALLDVEYDAICVLDADSCIIRNLDIWFEIADKADVIIGCGLEQKRTYGEGFEEHHKVDGKHILPKTWNEKDICCSPLFYSPKFSDAFVFSWKIFADYPPERRFRGPDMDSVNLSIMKFGYQNRVIALAEATWSGLHETLLKPCSHVCEMHGNLWTVNGEELFVLHGQFLSSVWQGWQLDGQLKMIDRELNGSETCKALARNCLAFLVDYVKKMAEYKVKIDG
jgi:hypothetical protein